MKSGTVRIAWPLQMVAQSPLRKPATLEDIKVSLKGKQPLQNGSSKSAKYYRTALNLEFFYGTLSITDGTS